MSYQVLARKWRPRDFSALVGQEHVVRALRHALETGRLHHAYLFTGTRGVGKTTLARILAKALNCETGVTSNPCGRCAACQEIDAGRFIDYLEVDAATNRGVDEMALLLEQAQYAPTRGRYKVLTIDEVHQLSPHAFNAMLKTLEEPPEHIKFVLATTDPQKIPVTVLSRCLQFNLRPMPPERIEAHLEYVLAAEGLSHEPGALREIARAAAGSMRDALSLLDQAIAHGAGRLATADVRALLGNTAEEQIRSILDALAAADAPALLRIADELAATGADFSDALARLARWLHRIAACQLAAGSILDETERATLDSYARSWDAEYVQLAYQMVIRGAADLPHAPDPATGFSMTLLRLVAFQPVQPPSLPARFVEPEQRDGSVPQANRSAEPVAATAVGSPPPVAPAGSSPPTMAVPTDAASWHDLVEGLALTGLIRELAHHLEWVALSGDVLQLRLAPAHRPMISGASQQKLQAELARALNRPLRLQIDITPPQADTPARRRADMQSNQRARAIESIEQDPLVRGLREQFDARIDPDRIRPL